MTREDWVEIPEFPDYAVNSSGEIYNMKSGIARKNSVNQSGITKISLYKGRELITRSVAVLVAEAFVEGQSEIFNTVMHLDGDRANCRAENLMWRPRWFAIKFHQQFYFPAFHADTPSVEDPVARKVYDTVKDCCIAEGHFYNDVFRSYMYGERMIFTGQVFNLL